MADETRSGGVDADAEGDLNVGGDVVGREIDRTLELLPASSKLDYNLSSGKT